MITITNEQIVLHTQAGLIGISLSDVPIITHQRDAGSDGCISHEGPA